MHIATTAMAEQRPAWQFKCEVRRKELAESMPPPYRLSWLLAKPETSPKSPDHGQICLLLLSEDEIALTETPTPVLVQRLQSGALLAETVVSAFCKRSAVAH